MSDESGSGSGANGPENTDSRPISVSELLARSRAEGGPAGSGTRESRGRRRVGREGSVSVSELTGEIPRIGSADADNTSPRSGGRRSDTGSFPRSATPVARRYAEDQPVPDRAAPPRRPAATPPTPDRPTPTSASGMPGYAQPATRDFHASEVARRAAKAEEAENANAVTGIIPVVGDNREGLVVVEQDDVDVVDLASPASEDYPTEDSPTEGTSTEEPSTAGMRPGSGDKRFAEVVDGDAAEDFEAYRAFADVEEDEPAPRKGLFGRFKKKNVDRSARPAAARERAAQAGGDSAAAAETESRSEVADVEPATPADGLDDRIDESDTLTASDRGAADEPSTGQTDGDSARPMGAGIAVTAAAGAAIAAAANARTEAIDTVETDPVDTDDATDVAPDEVTQVLPATADSGVTADIERDDLDHHDVDDRDVHDHDVHDHGLDDHDLHDTDLHDDLHHHDDHERDVDARVDDRDGGDSGAVDHTDTAEAPATETAKGEHSPALAWALIIGQALAGLAVGIGLFWGFTELWKWNVYFALVLAVLVIFGIVTFAHLVRRTKDLTTTLLAMGVGLIVTIGPLVLLAT